MPARIATPGIAEDGFVHPVVVHISEGQARVRLLAALVVHFPAFEREASSGEELQRILLRQLRRLIRQCGRWRIGRLRRQRADLLTLVIESHSRKAQCRQ